MSEGAKGSVFYGMHFYPGIAAYQEQDGGELRVFLNEDTIRSMDPSFAGRPIFVSHVDEVDSDIDEVKDEADGWVLESFFNASDGKHWVKFIIVSKRAERAIARGLKLSNCYVPNKYGSSGTWNGLDYDKEITGAIYEHLAIVPNPRYEESIIMTPDEFKKYNEEKLTELKRLSNSKEKGSSTMKFTFWKKEKVENTLDLENMMVSLPNTKREVSIAKLINEADEDGHTKMAHPDHMVDVDGERMTVKRMVDCYKQAMGKMKDSEEDMENEETEEEEEDAEKLHKEGKGREENEYPEVEADDSWEKKQEKGTKNPKTKEMNEEDEEEEKEKEEKKMKDSEKRKNAKEKADRLRNAPFNEATLIKPKVSTEEQKINYGKLKYGSGRF
jgi:hypothetical protein